MITGTKYWNNKDCYSIQDNNVFEECFKKKKTSGFLEDCGPTSAVNAIKAMQGPDFFNTFKIGEFTPQPEDLLTLFFNDFRNYPDFKKIRSDVNPSSTMCNRIPQFYPFAVKQLFNITCEFKWEKNWDKLKEYLKEGKAVEICQPGHFVTIVAYDEDTDEMIFNDPWAGHYATSGFNRRYSKTAFLEEVLSFIILFS